MVKEIHALIGKMTYTRARTRIWRVDERTLNFGGIRLQFQRKLCFLYAICAANVLVKWISISAGF
jgi:hypothetical protein